jgi:antitoxin CptB
MALTDPRRKRILYRAVHRGTKEADAIVGGFFTDVVERLTEAQLEGAEALLEELDLDLLDWLMGRTPVPARLNGTLYDDLAAYYQRMGT